MHPSAQALLASPPPEWSEALCEFLEAPPSRHTASSKGASLLAEGGTVIAGAVATGAVVAADAADAPTRASVGPAVARWTLTGTWILDEVRSEPLDPLLKAMRTPWVARQLVRRLPPPVTALVHSPGRELAELNGVTDNGAARRTFTIPLDGLSRDNQGAGGFGGATSARDDTASGGVTAVTVLRHESARVSGGVLRDHKRVLPSGQTLERTLRLELPNAPAVSVRRILTRTESSAPAQPWVSTKPGSADSSADAEPPAFHTAPPALAPAQRAAASTPRAQRAPCSRDSACVLAFAAAALAAAIVACVHVSRDESAWVLRWIFAVGEHETVGMLHT